MQNRGPTLTPPEIDHNFLKSLHKADWLVESRLDAKAVAEFLPFGC